MLNNLSPEAIKLLVSNTLYRAANTIRRIFLSVFIFKFAGDLKVLAIFSVVMLSFHMVGFYLCSIGVKKGYRNILNICAVFGMAIIFLVLTYNPYVIQNLYLPLGVITGVLSGMYWCVYSNNQFDFTIPKNRGNYEGIKKFLRTANTLLTPVIIGAIISFDYLGMGYQMAFALGAILLIISGLFGYMPLGKLHSSSEKFRLGVMVSKIMNHGQIWKSLLLLLFVAFALSTNLIETIAPLILNDIGVDELGIGVFVSLVSIVSMFASYIFGKFVPYSRYKLSFVCAGIMYLIFLAGLFLFPGSISFILFISSISLIYVFMDIPLTVFNSNILHEIPDYKNYRSEFLFLRELATSIGRIIVFIPLFFIDSLSVAGFSYIFIAMALAVVVSIIIFPTIQIEHRD